MESELHFHLHWAVERRPRNLPVALHRVSVTGREKPPIDCDRQKQHRAFRQLTAIQIAAASRGGKGRLNTRLIEGHTHYSHERSQLEPLTRTVDANCPFRIEFPKRGMIAARHGDHGGRPSRPWPQPQMRIELRGSARPGRPAPSARTDTVDTDFQGHAGSGAVDRHRTGQSMSDVARHVSWDKVTGLAEPDLLLDRAPTRVQRLKRNHVARVDRQRGCQLTGKNIRATPAVPGPNDALPSLLSPTVAHAPPT